MATPETKAVPAIAKTRDTIPGQHDEMTGARPTNPNITSN